jgi:dTMP kinase
METWYKGNIMTGRFIIFEGGDGVGKSTLVRNLHEALQSAGQPTVMTREPGGTPGAEQIRVLIKEGDANRFCPETHLSLHYAARFDHLKNFILPSLQAGKTVLCDRFEVSTAQYQVLGQKASVDLFKANHAYVVAQLREVITGATYVHCDLDPMVAQGRMMGEKGQQLGEVAAGNRHANDAYDNLPPDFHQRVREGRETAIGLIDPFFTHHVVDMSPEPDDIVQIVRDLLGL